MGAYKAQCVQIFLSKGHFSQKTDLGELLLISLSNEFSLSYRRKILFYVINNVIIK